MSESVRSPADAIRSRRIICKRLSLLQRDRRFVSIRFGDEPTLHQSVILEVNEAVGYLVLDAVVQGDAGTTVDAGNRCVVTAKERGVDAVFASTVLGCDDGGGGRSYRLALPARIERRERRNAFRVPVSQDARVAVRLQAESGEQWEPRLRNLSSTGLCLDVAEPFADTLRGRLDGVRCELTLDDADPIECALEVRSVRPGDEKGRHTVVGARFVKLRIRDGNAIDRFLMSESRKLQKRGVLV